MSEKTDKLRQDLMSAIKNLTQLASSGLVGDVEQDAFIKRFELAYELSWKWLQARIMVEGITARSPRQVFKESISLGYIQSEEAWLEMIEVR
ncbi:MAG: nucleotidyltransferase substrate binding protein, partial [Rhodothermaceae bacterium]|nr:nucleotidyltransferase substrate binding protein [Rhodothermaceae bacterium]